MNEDEKRLLWEESDALAKAMEFPLKPAGSAYAGKGEPPWGVNRKAARRKKVNERLTLYHKQLDEEAEKHGVPPSDVVDKKHRMEDWTDECATWEEEESREERDFRLKKKFEELFGREKITTARGLRLAPGNCCADGLIRVDKSVMKRKDGQLAQVDGFIKICLVCDKGHSRAAYLKGEKE